MVQSVEPEKAGTDRLAPRPARVRVRIDRTTPIPPFEQIRAQLALHVAAGRLVPGDRLPTIRTLATELGISSNTVARSYRQLIADGVAEAAGRRGTFVSAVPPVAHDVAERLEKLDNEADRFALTAIETGTQVDEALEIVIHAFRRMNDRVTTSRRHESLQEPTRSAGAREKVNPGQGHALA